MSRGVHNKNKLEEAKEERRLAREKRKQEKTQAERTKNPFKRLFKNKSTKK